MSTGGPGDRPLRRPGARRYALLLATIFAAFAIQGIANPAAWEQLLVTCLLGATLLLALWVAQARPALLRAAAITVVAMVLVSAVEAANGTVDGRAVRIANGLLVALAPPAIMVGVVRTLRAAQAVTLEAVFGVLSVYLLLGMFFAFVYGAIDHLGGHPFFAQGDPATVSRCLYFSFTTIATVGYGDLTARTNLGHTLAVSEALLGQIYLVTIVSLIVANLGRRRDPSAATRRAP
jgi:ion channel